MTSPERKKKIASYGKAYNALVRGLKRFPKKMWKFKPSPNDWSIHELIVHIADSEANSYVRCRKFIAEPGSAIAAYDEPIWARKLNYHAQSAADALELFRWLRRKSYTLIQDQPDAVWASTIFHPELGTITMDDWLDVYERHIPEHLTQMQGVYAKWKNQKRS